MNTAIAEYCISLKYSSRKFLPTSCLIDQERVDDNLRFSQAWVAESHVLWLASDIWVITQHPVNTPTVACEPVSVPYELN